MTLQEMATLLRGMGIPLAYHHFAEGESPDPPFLLYLSISESARGSGSCG